MAGNEHLSRRWWPLAGLFYVALATSADAAPTWSEILAWLDEHRNAEVNLSEGTVVASSNLERLAPWMPPGFLSQLEFPEFEAEIQETQSFSPHAAYRDASIQYGEQTVLREDRSLGHYVSGQPFSHDRILEAPPEDAAYMVAWNRVYRWQYYGYASDSIHLVYLKPGERQGRNTDVDRALVGGGLVERHLIERYQRVYLSKLAMLDGQDFALDVDGSDTLHYKELITFTHPFEMRGSTFVIERPLDAFEEDQVNSYLPTERRVRRLSPKERADSFVGSEFTLDDFEGFSGRVLDYEWSYHGRKRVLHVADSKGEHAKFYGPGSWIPKDRWQLRDCYVVEQRSTLPEHPYGRKLMFVDRENFNIPMALIFDREDNLFKILYSTYRWPGDDVDSEPSPAQTVAHWQSGVAINLAKENGSLVWADEVEVPKVKPSQVRRLFSVSNLTGGR